MTDRPPSMEPSREIARLVEIMAALRTPVTGCPWDLAQSLPTIAPYTIEEAYEVADAIERGDLVDLKEELGDLLLQVVYHARLGEEAGAFELGDVVLGITRKMIRRHPHVFGDERGATADQAKETWARIKAEERAEKAAERGCMAQSTVASHPASTSALADVPVGLPALTRAVKLQDKAAAVGFDWPSIVPVLDKVREEITELEEVAILAAPRRPEGQSSSLAGSEHAMPATRLDPDRIEEEYGDLLFVVANVGRHLGIDPEHALRRANRKFTTRFGQVEALLAQRAKSPAQSDLTEMDALWNEVKRGEKAAPDVKARRSPTDGT